MTISEVVKKYGLTADTLRYYERQGLIPPVSRTASGLRDYTEQDLRWVGFIRCMRGAGVSIEALTEYVSLFREGKDSISRRKEILTAEREKIAARVAELQAALDRLDKKLDGYEERMLLLEQNLYHAPD